MKFQKRPSDAYKMPKKPISRAAVGTELLSPPHTHTHRYPHGIPVPTADLPFSGLGSALTQLEELTAFPRPLSFRGGASCPLPKDPPPLLTRGLRTLALGRRP